MIALIFVAPEERPVQVSVVVRRENPASIPADHRPRPSPMLENPACGEGATQASPIHARLVASFHLAAPLQLNRRSHVALIAACVSNYP